MKLINKKNYTLDEILYIFELSWNDVPDIRQQHKSFEEAQKQLEEFKKVVKSAYRKIAKKYHPDTGGNEDDFKVINNIYEMLGKLNIQRIEPPKPKIHSVRVVRVYHGGSSYTSSSTTSTTDDFFYYNNA